MGRDSAPTEAILNAWAKGMSPARILKEPELIKYAERRGGPFAEEICH